MTNNVIVITISLDQLQDMLDKAAERAALSSARTSGEQWGVKELAAHYNVSARTIRNRELAGALPPRIGRHWRKADVLRWDSERRPN